MPRNLNTQMMAEEFDKKGVFKGLSDFVKEGSMSPLQATEARAQVFNIFLKQVQEAKNEVNRLNGSIARLEQICRAGAGIRPSPNWVDRPPEIDRLATEIVTFDGWVVSLYETAITMMYLGNPDRARAKPTEMANSLEALRQKRLKQLKLDLKDPSLFIFA